ncbi:unnamed protein product [Danaus chrysippus]|uniref:(African queen) hypothetical protein n=1 Tax=Danaus chrysippus TaxID=151541 RepID=A0A8J2WEY7_9NEOP|nr:unnamed protein product [Danaus chrysippus]
MLEAGSGPATRRAAANQLGEVQKAHPEELHRLLARLMKHLKSPAWETRVAATQAVEAILSHVPEWLPPPYTAKEEDIEQDDNSRLRCETFDIDRVLEHGAHLMGSEGHEYDLDEETLSATDMKERLTKQRQNLNSRLGLDVAASLGVDLSGVYSNEDLCIQKTATTPTNRRPVQELVLSKGLSSREMNLAKRKARLAFSKQKSRDCEESPTTTPTTPTTPTASTATTTMEPERKKIKLEQTDDTILEVSGCAVPSRDGSWGEGHRWPLGAWSGALTVQLLSGAWEARHGAASAIRELLRAPIVRSAGWKAGMTPQQMEDSHQEWLEDMALRLLCVLALDRFGDFVSDQVVAPVRESSAQALGVCLSRLRAERVCLVARALGGLARHAQWEARHGALLAFKYLLAARREVAIECGALELLMSGLEDSAEDVSGVAAGALALAADALAAARQTQLARLAARLWALLRDQDELAAPAHKYMALLAALMALPAAAAQLHPIDLADVLPRLWPYLDHSTSSVRKATLQTLRTITRPLITTTSNGQNGDRNENNDAQNDIENSKESDTQVVENGDSNNYLQWTPELLQDTMRHVYQRVLFEHVDDIQEIALQVWENLLHHADLGVILVASCPLLSLWMCLAMQPARLPLDPALLLHTPTKERTCRVRIGGVTQSNNESEPRPSQKWYLGGSESQSATIRDANVTKARCLAAEMLGHLSCYLVQPAPGIEYKAEDESPIDCYVRVMLVYLRSSSALQRLVAGLVLASWARNSLRYGLYPPHLKHMETREDNLSVISKLAPPSLVTALHTALNQTLYYDEVALNCNRILQEARDLLAMIKHYKLPVDNEEYNNILRLEQVSMLAAGCEAAVAGARSKRVAASLEERRVALLEAARAATREHAALAVAVQAALSSAVAQLAALPERLNPVVRPLMESIKKEASEELQKLSAGTLAALLAQLVHRQPCPNNKVLSNLKAFLSCDPEFTPRINLETTEEVNGDSGSGDSGGETEGPANQTPSLDKYEGILTLREQQRSAERLVTRRGRPPAHTHTNAHNDLTLDQMFPHEDEARKLLRIQRRGATMALTSLTEYFGDDLPEKLPRLWEFIIEPFEKVMSDEELENIPEEVVEELISRLQVVEAVAGSVGRRVPNITRFIESKGKDDKHASDSDSAKEKAGSSSVSGSGRVWARVVSGVGACAALCRARHTALRHMAARALAAIAQRDPHPVMRVLVDELVSSLEHPSPRVRCGAAEGLARVVDSLQLNVVPYIALLVVPLLGRMSDHNPSVRTMSTRCFATLIQLMPLDGPAAAPPDLSPDMLHRRNKDKTFLDQLFNPKTIKDYKIPIPVTAELRSYQQAGVNWLRFLNEYKLHGVLCDDMGLGKTLQSVVVVAGSHYERAQSGAPQMPSLVVCPPTLTGHWVFEVTKFIPSQYLKPLPYVGPPVERERLRAQVPFYNLIVASYDIVRKDIDFFSGIKWNYCILDEGHVIKNGKTKAFKAIKQIVANHRLILSGTPIQNNVLELWSLFDFLMPGLLGSERQFTARYSRPLLAARDPRASPHHLQAGALACEALHRQVLPFLLRRVKEDVLRELPPKITQDYYCDLSPLQRRLYEHFSKEHMPQEATHSHTHVFQALHYLQNVCNHPKLVLMDSHPETSRVTQQLAAAGSSLDDIQHGAKLPALKQLLLDCGIGSASTGEESAVVSQHRALIFCQLKKMLDIVEKDLIQKHLPSVSYLRLDGSVPPHQRHAIVTRFNTDVSIDVLLLTTAVGGLGLNLTGADTVIFVEHDWNPMKDLQAMDRAHRIGQKKVVNVYRLITRDTLEEKIMGLQKFKLMTANTVISSENAALETMGTDQLLDLFQSPGSGPSSGSTGAQCSKSLIENLPDLWDDKLYEEEYDMTNFIKSLKK